MLPVRNDESVPCVAREQDQPGRGRWPRSEQARQVAAVLLVGLLTRHQLWELVPPQIQAKVWNVCGALVMLALLAYVGYKERSLLVWVVIELWAYEENLVLVCTTWRMLDPWIVGPGEGQCSAKLGFRLSIITTVVAGIIAINILDRLRSSNQGDRQ